MQLKLSLFRLKHIFSNFIPHLHVDGSHCTAVGAVVEGETGEVLTSEFLTKVLERSYLSF
mgnify:CR=1 FL=1